MCNMSDDNNKSATPAIPSDLDILCGRDKKCAAHDGNHHFNRILDMYRESYQSAMEKTERMRITKEIVDLVRANNRRFLKYSNASKCWEELSEGAARDKISHALRRPRRASSTRSLRMNSEDSGSSLSSMLANTLANVERISPSPSDVPETVDVPLYCGTANSSTTRSTPNNNRRRSISRFMSRQQSAPMLSPMEDIVKGNHKMLTDERSGAETGIAPRLKARIESVISDVYSTLHQDVEGEEHYPTADMVPSSANILSQQGGGRPHHHNRYRGMSLPGPIPAHTTPAPPVPQRASLGGGGSISTVLWQQRQQQQQQRPYPFCLTRQWSSTVGVPGHPYGSQPHDASWPARNVPFYSQEEPQWETTNQLAGELPSALQHRLGRDEERIDLNHETAEDLMNQPLLDF